MLQAWQKPPIGHIFAINNNNNIVNSNKILFFLFKSFEFLLFSDVFFIIQRGDPFFPS